MKWFSGLAALALAAAPAMAQPKLLSSSPAAKAAVSKPTQVSLRFSEKLTAGRSSIALVMTGMPGMAQHAPMKMTGFTTGLSPDGRTLIAKFPRALPAGSYALTWSVAAADNRVVQGNLVFSAK